MRPSQPAALARHWLLLSLLLAMLNLLAGLSGGLQRLGLPLAAGSQTLAGHGVFMMAGFFATLISLERAVALRRGVWVPLASGAAGLLAWAGLWPWAAGLWVFSALGLLGLYLWAGRYRAVSLPLAVEATGALALLWAALAFALGAAGQARWGWSLFLVLTIVGERRELMRLRPLPRWAAQAFLCAWALLVAVALLMGVWPEQAARLGWAVLGLLALWLLRFDLARLQWRLPGWAGHTAICLLLGYVWLLAAAVAGLLGQGAAGGVAWHLLWLGFVFAMVFGHAPLMLPPLAGLRPRPSRWALVPLALMGASLLLRTLAWLGGWADGLALAGVGHGLALLLFALTMAWLLRPEPRANA
ncbi:hypothetical protein HNP55_002764 [Paucibacter oligotrophus]|uniref:NnrS family protein n=1 Tax=Roseateles oligotrophus TaxID=1769250 RepID=A0A840LDF5_9BURK|nr:hypothetical protein [Roseateles oligotrophus]MBB4844228.1 hypothetical protein [Roseateles oligotrophus]